MRAITMEAEIPIVSGFLPAKELVERRDIPERHSEAGTGYQREPSEERVRELANGLASGSVSLPTAVLLNVREFDGSQLLEQRGDKTWLRLRGEKLRVVDGQHRVRALEMLVKQDGETWGGYSVPFVAMLGAEEREEIWQFFLVNSKARSVKVDLAYDILKQRADEDADFKNTLKQQDQWKVAGQTLAEKLANTPVWRDRIQFPGPKRVGATVRSGSFVSSLRPALRDRAFMKLALDDQFRALDAYWRAVQDALPEVFEEPGDYLMQRTVGVYAMHAFFLDVFVIVQARHESVKHVTAYANVLTPALHDLQDETRDGVMVKGADFWRKGRAGAAGGYSSGAGHGRLASMMAKLLPAVSIR